ncbi:MAG: prepilin-type N-terminal cleavage/methylation domain-containing protein, partial [Candidatus Saccharibacteria bacterium]|nr:prepilin-type N-terminal cleavage/methylation domain-containing protein [Candidatus Saccharibacteria bacterium]
MKNKRGFTVLEIIICIVIAGIFVVLFFLQKQDVAKMDRDTQRNIAIYALSYALEEGFYKDNGYYPES